MATKRGRKSVAEQATNLRVLPTALHKRPSPPDGLTERQCEIWQAVVDSEPVEWFQTAALQSMLADLCRHREAIEQISEVLSMFKSDWLKNEEGAKRYNNLSRMRREETKAAASLAGKLRLTNQSRYTPQAAGTASRNAAKTPPPWEM